MNKLELEKIANNIRKETISMIHNAKSGHPGGSLSACVDLMIPLRTS